MIKIFDFENISISNCELEFGFDFSHFEFLHTLDPHNNLRLHHNSILLFCQWQTTFITTCERALLNKTSDKMTPGFNFLTKMNSVFITSNV